MSLDSAYAGRIIPAVKIIALKICFCANDIVVIYSAAKCCIDARIVAAQQSSEGIIRSNIDIDIVSSIF